MSTTQLEELDVSRVRGLFVVTTKNSRYFVEANERTTGFVRWITDSPNISNVVQEGCVGQNGTVLEHPTLVSLGECMIIGRALDPNPLTTTPVKAIEPAPAGVTMSDLICKRCKRGFKEGDKPCALCRY